MRIAFLARPESSNGYYRGIGPMQALADRGHSVRPLPVRGDSPQPVGSLDDVDVLHIHRYCEDRAWRIARGAKAAGAAVVWDDDDNLPLMPRGVAHQRNWGGFAGQRRRANMRRLFQATDVVTTPSAPLAEQLRGDGAPEAQVIPNFVADETLLPARTPRAGVTIGWCAGLEHAADVQRLPILPALQRLLDERADVRVVSFGLRLGLRSERYEHDPHVPLQELTVRLAEFDVGIAPLSDIAFNRSRSDIKLKEYAAAGACWLASPVGPYADLGEKQGGRLVPDDRWHEELVRLIEKPKDRAKLAKRAGKWVASQTLSRNAELWERALESAIERAGGRAAVA